MTQRQAPACRGFRRKFAILAGIKAMLAAAALCCAAIAARSEPASTFVAWPHPAPAFALPTISGGEARLDASRGRVVAVHFFATWCAPCREELPALQAFAKDAAAAGVDVVVISVAEPDGRVRRFVEETGLSFDIALDRDRAVAKAWRIDALPSTVVLAPDPLSGLAPRLGVEGDFAWGSLTAQRLAAMAAAPRQADK